MYSIKNAIYANVMGENRSEKGRAINDYQMDFYGKEARSLIFSMFEDDLKEIREMKRNSSDILRVLDIGCGSGLISESVYNFFDGEIEVYSIDNVVYNSWSKWDNYERLHFINVSAFDMNTIFKEIKFDIIICACVIHHLILDDIKNTIKMQKKFMLDCRNLLKDDGKILVTECSLESYIGEVSTYIHYFLTHIRNPMVARIVRKIGGKSAGTGTYFRSYKKLIEFFESNDFVIEKKYPPVYLYRFNNGLKGCLARCILLCREHRSDFGFVLSKKYKNMNI